MGVNTPMALISFHPAKYQGFLPVLRYVTGMVKHSGSDTWKKKKAPDISAGSFFSARVGAYSFVPQSADISANFL